MEFRKEKNTLLILFFASGISGLIYEVVWMRMLSRVFGVTTYATSITMAAFMAGLAIGSYAFGKMGDRSKNPLKIYMLLQIFTAVFAVVTPLLFSAAIPLYRWIYETSGESMAVVKISKAVISFAVLLIPTTLMGGTLPVLVSHLTRKDSGFGKNLSIMYSINTMGAVAGVILSGFFTIGLFGEWATILIGAALNLAAADGAAILGRRTARDEGKKASILSGKASKYPLIPAA